VIALIRFFVVPGAVVPWKAQPPGVKWSVNRDLVSVAAASQKKFCRRPLVDITGQTADSVLQPLSASDGVHILAAPRLNALARPVAATKRKGSGWPRGPRRHRAQQRYRAVDRMSVPSSDNVSVQAVRKPPSSAVHRWTTIASDNTRPRSGREYGGVLWRDSLQDWLWAWPLRRC